MSMTSPAFSPIWMRSPTSKGWRQMMNSQPKKLVIGSCRAMANPAESKPRKVAADRRSSIQIRPINSATSAKARYSDLFRQRYRTLASVVRRVMRASTISLTAQTVVRTISVKKSFSCVLSDKRRLCSIHRVSVSMICCCLQFMWICVRAAHLSIDHFRRMMTKLLLSLLTNLPSKNHWVAYED